MVDVGLIQGIVRERMASLEGTAHGYSHVDRVMRIASFIAGREGGDLEAVQVGSLLHDIGRAVGDPHAETGVEPAREILLEAGYPHEAVDGVLHIVRFHHVGGRGRLETLEGRIVWDADKVDLIGLTGVSRAFHHAGEKSIPYEDVFRLFLDRVMAQPYEFFTGTGKRLADRRYDEMRHFVATLRSELTLLDIV